MKTWLVTGCSSGIGRGIALAALKEADNRVIVTARNTDDIQDIVDNYSENAIPKSLDVTDKKNIESVIEEVVTNYGSVDVLVNNAGYAHRGAIEEVEISEIDRIFQTNLFGPLHLIRAVLPQMRKTHSGLIINVSSGAAVEADIGSGYYGATKSALESFSEALRKETDTLGIEVVVVVPGVFDTNFYSSSLSDSSTVIGDYKSTAGMNRKANQDPNQFTYGDPEKAGEVIVTISQQNKKPNRLTLGSDEVANSTEKYNERLDELRRWEEISNKTDN